MKNKREKENKSKLTSSEISFSKTVNLLLPNLSGGGAEKVFLYLLNSLPKKHSSLTLLKMEGNLISLLPDDIKIYVVGVERARNAIFSLAKIFSQKKPEIIVSTMAYFNFIVTLAILFSSHQPKRIIFREANTTNSTTEKFLFSWFGKLLYRWAYNKADLVICNSPHIREELIHLKVRPELIKVIPNPVPIKEIRRLSNSHFSADFIKNKNLPLFIFVGRLTEQKGADILIRAMYEMENNANLLIIGQGEEKQSLEDLVQKLKLNDFVYFLDFKNNPYPYMKAATAVILPSRWEGLPNVGLEALALGKLVVATAQTGGLTELTSEIPKKHLKIVNNLEELKVTLNKLSKSNFDTKKKSMRNLLPKRFEHETVLNEYKKAILGK